jgi:hypothetical protein
MGPDFPGIFPSNGSVFRQPLSSRGSLRIGSLSQVVRAAPTSCRPSRLASFPSFDGTTPLPVVRSQRSRYPFLWAGVIWSVASPTTALLAETAGSPRFLVSSMHSCPVHRPRRDHRARPFRLSGAAFRLTQAVGSRTWLSFEAPSHGLNAPCVRFAESVTLPHATLGTGCWPALPGRIAYPLRTSAKFPDCLSHLSSSPRLCLALG